MSKRTRKSSAAAKRRKSQRRRRNPIHAMNPAKRLTRRKSTKSGSKRRRSNPPGGMLAHPLAQAAIGGLGAAVVDGVAAKFIADPDTARIVGPAAVGAVGLFVATSSKTSKYKQAGIAALGAAALGFGRKLTDKVGLPSSEVGTLEYTAVNPSVGTLEYTAVNPTVGYDDITSPSFVGY